LGLQNGASVPLAERTVLDEIEHGLGEIEQAHGVGDRRAALADLRRDGLRREVELVAEPLEGARRLDGVQILPLEVLDERSLEGRLVTELANEDGDLEEAGLLRGPPTALARDDLVCRLLLEKKQDGLEDAVRANALGELSEGLLVEALARLNLAALE